MENQGINEIMSLQVEVNMRKNPPEASPWDPVTLVVEKMLGADIGAIIVVERDRIPVGIITEKDLIERVVDLNRDVDLTTAREVMTTPVITIEAEETIAEALKIMHQNNIRRLAVTQKNLLVGIVTERRLLETVFREI
jgi:signal-transduction protein with cAMP-binding, CBS, and nucleotidyltransferase domain